ncbi:MAG: alkaline phosphatase [Planctomycetota bacterium]
MRASGISRRAIASSAFLFVSFLSPVGAEPRNAILLIGDGMGREQVKAAGMYAHGSGGTLVFETLPRQGQMTTHSADNSITDSAAAAAAMATGVKVNNGVVSMAYPGDGSELTTLLEHFMARGKAVGLVTTTRMTDATPAAFGAHEASRTNEDGIAQDYLTQTRPNVLLGGGGHGMTPSSAAAAGYTVVADRAGLLALDTENVSMVSGQFGDGDFPYEYDGTGYGTTYPHLYEMTQVALQVLEDDPDGFFLMVEGGLIDHACHANHLARMLGEVLAFEEAVAAVLEWAQGRDDTLIIVTADHETGGLGVTRNNGQGAYPTVCWASTGHTGAPVPIYARGPGSERILGTLDNTDIFFISLEPSVELVSPPVGSVIASTAVDFAARLYDQAGLVSAALYLGKAPRTLTLSGPDAMDDAQLNANDPDANYGGAASIKVDGQDPHAHAVVKFPSLIGSGPGQIPLGSAIVWASLKVRCTNPGNAMTVDRLLEGWSEDAVSWNSPWTDAGADGSSSRAYETVTAPASATGWLSLDVTPFVQAWADGSPNHGIVLLDGGTDGVEFDSSESANAPVLSVGFTAGVWDELATQELEGTSANVTFASQSLGDGEGYVWNVLVTNSAGVSGWARADASFRAEEETDFPGQPELVWPAEGATGISPSPALEVQASDPSEGPLDVTFYGRGGPRQRSSRSSCFRTRRNTPCPTARTRPTSFPRPNGSSPISPRSTSSL